MNRLPISIVAALTVALGIAAGVHVGYERGMQLERREPGTEQVAAPVAPESRPAGVVGATIQMTPTQYAPQSASIRAGELVEFRNAGPADQWPEAISGPFSAPGVVKSGKSWFFRLSEPGTYEYKDRVFPNVTARIEVR